MPKESPEALSQAILEILSDDKKRGEMVQASLKIAESFSWDTMARKYMELYVTPSPRKA